MKLEHTRVPDVVLRVSIPEAQRFRIAYDGRGGREDGTLEVWGLRVSVDLASGEGTMLATGYLVNKDGNVGERGREQFLTAGQFPQAAKDLAFVEVADLRRAIGEMKPVTFS